MSNKYQADLPREEMERILEEEDTCVICLSDGGSPYAVPVSYAWIDGKILLHCAVTGKKLDIIRKNPRTCFLVDRHPERTRPHSPEGECTYRFESVLCFGTARIIDQVPERMEYLKAFKKHFDLRLNLPLDKNPVNEKAAEHCGCVIISVDSMTGRKKGK